MSKNQDKRYMDEIFEMFNDNKTKDEQFLLQIEEENVEKREISSSLDFENLERESVTSL